MLEYKVENNIVEFTGSFPYWKHVSKSVVVDGVTYTNERYEDAVMNVSDMDQIYFSVSRYDLPFLNYYMAIKDSSQFTHSLLRQYYGHKSDNKTVNAWLFLFDEGLIDKRVLNVYTNKLHEWYLFDEKSTVPLMIYSYGFNNGLFVNVSLRTFLTIKDKSTILNIDSLSRKFKQRFDIDISKEIGINESIKIINTIIKEKS